MDTFRKWLNKPKADDKSLLARFYHADRSLQAVASELDSFDGRAEPDRCSRLVSRLRQSQDKVLSITNLIMDELLGDDRDPRSFRAKFPEEVLQENLAGQLWFGAECLAAGSSIMSREQESKEMRPLAQAVTKSLGNVRNLLRDQCLRNNVPNSRTLRLDLNDSSTEQLCESLKIFDRLFAEFELRYVSAMVQVKTKHEYEMQELICVLFSETLQRALTIGLLEQDKVDSFDPALMFSIPRLAIIAGLVIYHRGPLNMDMAADQLSEMFRPFRPILIKIRDLLRILNKSELNQLERLLCTNEDINMKVPVCSSNIEAPPACDRENNNNNNSGGNNANSNSNSGSGITCHMDKGDGASQHSETDLERPTTTTTTSSIRENNNNNPSGIGPDNKKFYEAVSKSRKKLLHHVIGNATYTTLTDTRHSPTLSDSSDSSAPSTPTVSPAVSPTPSHSVASTYSADSTSTSSPTDWTDDEVGASDVDEDAIEYDLSKELDIVSTDCASGYLVPNTNFGNLLQPQQVPLTDNFVASEDEFANNLADPKYAANSSEDLPTTSTSALPLQSRYASPQADSSEESEQLTVKASEESSASGASKSKSIEESFSTSSGSCAGKRRQHGLQNLPETVGTNSVVERSSRHRHYHHVHRHHHHHHHHHRPKHSKKKRFSMTGAESDEGEIVKPTTSVGTAKTRTLSRPWASQRTANEDISSVDSTSSSQSDGDPHEPSLALRVAGRLKFKSTENLLHRLFVCIAGVADQLQTNFASDLRHILRSVFLMNMTLSQEEILDIPEKTKDSELFEFRASENDVIQQSVGSNQSIYSAEEVNPELDNVFSGSDTGVVIQRVHTVDLGVPGEATASTNRNSIERSHSLGDQPSDEMATSTNTHNMRSIISGRCLSSTSRQSVTPQRHRNRTNTSFTNLSPTTSPSSTSASSSSERNSPVSERVSPCFPPAVNCNQSCTTNSVTAATINNRRRTTESGSPHSQSQSTCLAPPAWIPDEKAPRCMSCHTPFTAFRRRHHCRNCGGVFCGVCSNASAPLPKYGLTKAVRMCRECYIREACSVSSVSVRNNSAPHVGGPTLPPSTAAAVGS